MDTFSVLFVAALNAATPLLLAGLGLLLSERSGVLNLGAEGMMLLAAAVGYAVGLHSASLSLGLLAGMLAGVAAAAVFALLVVGLAVNQYAAGLGLTLAASGLAALLGQPLLGQSLSARPQLAQPMMAQPLIEHLPDLGATLPALLAWHPVVWLALALTAVTAWWLQRTRGGLLLRAVGESAEAAYALGLPVRRVRLAAVLFGGACCGLAGAWLSLVHVASWSEGVVAGRGWIALALTAFASWRPWRLALGAWLFGSLTLLQFYLQGLGLQASPQLLAMLPYLATIVALVLISRRPAFIRVNMPASLGKPFHPT